MDASMDPLENYDNSEGQQSQTSGTESSARPSLSQVKKSWGFRRTTIARREFMDEVGELSHSPPPTRRGRSRRSNQPTPETQVTRKATHASRNVIDELEWSAPSSPAAEEKQPASETTATGGFDPSGWEDFGSAFHTAFSLLGGDEGLPLEMSGALAVPDILETTDTVESPPLQETDENEGPDNTEPAEDMEISEPVASDSVAEGENDDIVLISSQEDSDEMTLIQIRERLAAKSRQEKTEAKGRKGGRGKARGRGRGRSRARGKGRAKGRGRGRAVELQAIIADDEESSDEVVLVHPDEEKLQGEEKVSHPNIPSETERTPPHSDTSMSPAQRSSSDCIIIDTDIDQATDVTPGQYDDAPEEEEEEKKDNNNVEEHSGISDSDGSDPNLYCICRQKQNKRFMICCDGCQEWFHGDCVGISETQGQKMERTGQDYICPRCTAKKESKLQPELHPEPEPEPEPELKFPECLTPSPAAVVEEAQNHKETVMVVEDEEVEEVPVTKLEPESKAEMETDGSLPLCIGPGCSKQALPDSVYCGTDCILQHAAAAMKTLSVPKVPKARERPLRKAAAAAARLSAKGQKPSRMSKRLAGKSEEEEEEMKEEVEVEEEDDGQKKAPSPLACKASLTEVQATSIPSSQLNTASKKDSELLETVNDTLATSKQSAEEPSTDAANASQTATVAVMPQSLSPEKTQEPIDSDVSKQQPAESDPSITPEPEKSTLTEDAQSPPTSAPEHHDTDPLMVNKTSYVIPKKQSAPAPLSSHISASVLSHQKPSAPTLLNETRNLLVPPAPSAPSSRPSQPNNQIRQSIQRSLSSILSKMVCECEDLEMSETQVVKLVASIEMEMFNIFRNTDSKYMNKYRTIMFNLKDPKNKGLLYRVVRGEISPFRLVRMSQKDMQAIKAAEPSAKETTQVKDATPKLPALLPKPEAVKVDLPSLNPSRPDRSMEQKKSLPVPALKTRSIQPLQSSAVPDILTCMLKDTTSEHKTHLFDLKCKICTGQMLPGEEEEPAKKKPKISETRETYEPSWRKFADDDSPLRAPPDSPDMDSPTSPPRLVIDAPALTIVESPASPIQDSPASPTLESPASPVMESPASPTSEAPKAAKQNRAYAPVVIPAVSTVTITRRDPRTAASRFSASSSGTSALSNTSANKPPPYAPIKETRPAMSSTAAPPLQQSKILPKSILMKPSSSSDPRLYGTSSRTVISESPVHGETAQFLAKQEIVWKGFLNMLSVAKFVTKAYLVSGPAENLKADLPDTIQIGGRILPQTVWDYVAKLKTSVTKDLCVIRFHPATEEEEVAYVSLFSYFSSRGRFGVVANGSRSIKDVYLVPLSAKEAIPSILQPLEGPGLERNRPNLLLGLAITQKTKRVGSLPQEIEEKRPKVQMPKDPMWIPKPPVLYGSDKLEMFQPYNPETPTSNSPPVTPPCPGSPSESPSSGSVATPAPLTSIRPNPPVSTSSAVAATPSTSSSISNNTPTAAASDKMPLQTIFKTLFSNKQADSVASDGSSTAGGNKLQMSGSMVDPIVQQFGLKSKVKEREVKESDLDRPYDPEEEYDPAMGYKVVAPNNKEKDRVDELATSGVDDDVAYDPEDETIFADIQSDGVRKPSAQTDSSSLPTPVSTQDVIPTSTLTPVQTSTPTGITEDSPPVTVVVSAATLTEQQRMLEELNKQIEEQKRQLKEQEEALRQQREAVGMFMAHFSVSDSLMSPPQKTLPLSQLSTLQTGKLQTESKSSESLDKNSNVDNADLDSKEKPEDTDNKNDTSNVTEQDEIQENVKDSDKSAGEIEDSDVAYDPEDESLFNEIQDDVFQAASSKVGSSSSHKSGGQNSHHSRKRRRSPKRRSHRERDQHRSPSKRSQRRSPSRSRRHRERDRHRRSERDRSRHRARDHSERQGRLRKEHSTSRHSRGHRRSPSSSTDQKHIGPLSQVPDSKDTTAGEFAETNTPCTLVTIKNDPDGQQLKLNPEESLDKALLPCSHEGLQNVKLEISEPSESKELQGNSVNDHESKNNSLSTLEDKLSREEAMLKEKFEIPIPLREIDPPTRDSPQSPDPEPQFAKPSSVENSKEIGEIKDTETSNVDSIPLKTENICLPIAGQATFPNTLWQNTKSTILNQILETAKRIKGECPNPVKGSDNQGPGPEKDYVKTLPGPDITHGEPGPRGQTPPVTNPYTGAFQPSSHGPGAGMGGPGSAIYNPGTDKRGLFSSLKGPELGHAGTPVFEEKGPWRGGSQTHAKDTHLNRVSGSHGVFLDPKPSTNSGTIVQSADRQFPAMAGERQGPHGGQHVPWPNISCMGQGTVEPRGNFQQLDMRSGGIQGSRNEQDLRDPKANMINTDMRPPGPDMRGQISQNEVLDQEWSGPGSDRTEHGREPNRRGSGPLRGGPFIKDLQKLERSDAGDQHFREQGPGMRGPNMEDPRHDRRGPGGPVFNPLEPETKSPNNNILGGPGMRGPGGPDFVGPGLKMSGQAMEGPGPNFRGPSVPDFKGPWPGKRGPDLLGPVPERREDQGVWGRGLESIGPNMGDPGTYRREGQSSDFNEPGPERRGEGPGPDRRRTGGSDFIRPGSEGRHPALQGPGPDRRIPGGPDYRGPGPEWRGPAMEGPRPDRRGPGGPDFRGQGCEGRGPNMEDPWLDSRGPGGPDFRGPGPEGRVTAMEGPGPDRRGPGCPDFRGPGPEWRGPTIEGPGPDSRGPGGPDFMGPGPEGRGTALGGPGPDRRGPGGPDFRGPGPEWRGPSMDGPGPHRRGPGGPDFRGPGPEGGGPTMEGPGPDRRGPGGLDFRGPGPEGMGTALEGPGPDRRGPGGPDFRGPGPEWRGPAMDGPGPDRRGPGGLEFRGPGPVHGGPAMEGPRPDRRGPGDPDIRGPGPEWRGHVMEGPGLDRRGPGGPDPRENFSNDHPRPGNGGPQGADFRGPRPEWRGPAIDCPGPDRRGPGGPELRGTGPARRGPAMDNPGPDNIGPGGPNFRGGSERRGPDMGAREREREAGVGGPVHERFLNMDCQEHKLRGPEGPHLHPPGPERRFCATDGPRPDRRGCPELRGPECERRGPAMEGGLDRRDCLLRGPDPDLIGQGWDRTGPGMEGPGPHSRGPGEPRFRESGHPNMEGQGPVGRVPDMRTQRPERQDSFLEGPGPNRRRPEHSRQDYSGPDRRGPEPGPEGRPPYLQGEENSRNFSRGSQFRGPEPERRYPEKCQDSERRGTEFQEVGPGRHVMGDAGPNRRGSMGSDFRGPGRENRGLDFEGPRLDRQQFEHERLGPDMEGPGPDWRGSGVSDFRDPGVRHRDDWGGDDFAGSEHIQENPDFRRSMSDRTGRETQEPWSDRRRPNMESIGNERERDEYDWKRHGNRGPGPFREGPHSRKSPANDMRDPERRGSRQDRPNMPFSGPHRGPEDDLRGPGNRGPRPVHGDPACTGPGWGGPGNEWRESDRGDDRHERFGPFRGENDPNNRSGSDMRRDSGRGNDWRPPDFRDNMGRPGGVDGRFSEFWEEGAENQSVDMEGPGSSRCRFDQEFRRERRGQDMRGQGSESTDMRHRHGRRETSRGSGSASPHFSSPRSRFQSPSDPQSGPHGGQPGPSQHNESNFGFNHKNQQAVKPPRHRAALLPTPTEGLIRCPNRMINNPRVFSPKQKQSGPPTDREQSRGTPVSQDRELRKEQRQEHEKSPASKISLPAGKGGGAEGNKTDKRD